MTLKGGTSPACAACKYQRRKCSTTCKLAPYFRPDQPKTFQNAHKLFGVRNILKILKEIDPAQVPEAMKSIIYQANVRDQYPVSGCLEVMRQLYAHIQMVEEELHAVSTQLAMCKQQQMASVDDAPSQLQLAMAPPTNALPYYSHHTPQAAYPPAMAPALPLSQQHCYSTGNNNAAFGSAYLDTKDSVGSSLWGGPHSIPPANNNNINTSNNNTTAMAIQSQLAQQPLAVQQVVEEYDEIHPFFDTIDDRQSYIDSKEAYDSR